MQEREIDLIKVLYKACREWRKAIACGVILGLLLGGLTVLKDIKVLNDEEKLAAAQATFEIEHQGWAAEETTLNAQLDNLRTERARWLSYNDESVLMKIDPLNEYVGTFELYVDSGYQISPELTSQNIDYTSRILSAYSSYMNGGEMDEYILANTSIVSERKYLKEILSCSVDYSASHIVVNAIGASEKDVTTLFVLVKSGIAEKFETISNSISKHKYSVINETLYTQVDFVLEDTQTNNTNKISVIDQSMSEVNAELTKWKAKAEPEFEYEPMEIFKEFIKKGIIGGVVGVILVCGYYFVAAVFSNKYSSDNLAYCTPEGTKDLGTVYIDRPRRKMGKTDNLIAKIFGINTNVLSLADSSALVGSNIGNIAKTLEEPKIAYVGLGDAALSKQIAEKMHCSIDYAGDITNCVEASKSLQNYTHVVIAAEEDVNSMEEIQRQCDLVKGWGKDIIGVVTIK